MPQEEGIDPVEMRAPARSERDRLRRYCPGFGAPRLGDGGWRWWAVDEQLGEGITSLAARFEGAPDPRYAELSDRETRAYFTAEVGGRRLFVKVVTLEHVKERLRASLRLAPGPLGIKSPVIEAANTLAARRFLPSAPAVLAFGERRAGLLATHQAIAFEFVPDVLSLHEVLATPAPSAPLLRRAFELARSLADGCFLHLDLNSNNVLLGASPSGDRAIDFELCARGRDPGEVLAFYLGNLYRSRAREHVNEAEYDALARPYLDPAWPKTYELFKRKRFSFRSRLRILGAGRLW